MLFGIEPQRLLQHETLHLTLLDAKCEIQTCVLSAGQMEQDCWGYDQGSTV